MWVQTVGLREGMGRQQEMAGGWIFNTTPFQESSWNKGIHMDLGELKQKEEEESDLF